MAAKDILRFNDKDGKLHLYIAAAYKGDRWVAQIIFGENQRTVSYFKRQGEGLVSATIRSLLQNKIISE